MKRDVDTLAKTGFELLVVGGGVYGAWTAYIAALSGVKTALIDRGDWACGTSSASSKLIHGGLRYLEQFRLGLVRSSLDERRVLSGVAPHRVKPLRFVLPVYRGDRVGRSRLSAGLGLYDFVSGSGQPVARHRYLSPRKARTRVPDLGPDGLKGAFSYGDCVTDDARFTLEVVDGGARAGVVAANYVEAENVVFRSGAVAGVAAVDRTTGRRFDIRARVVVNAAGPWTSGAMGGDAAPGAVRLVKGVHLVMPGLESEHALLFFSRSDRRVIFVIPWYGRTLLGTTDTAIAGDPSAVRVEAADVDYLLGEVNRVLPEVEWDRSAIVGGFAGVRALSEVAGRESESLSREWSLESPRPGILACVGGKFTTARTDATRIVSRVLGELGLPADRVADTRSLPFPWRPTGRPAAKSGLDPEIESSLAARYGARAGEVVALVRSRRELGERIVAGMPFIGAEVVYAAAAEGAVTLEDILRRRIPLLVLAPPDRATVERAARLAAGALGWDEGRAGNEVAEVIRKYKSPPV
jgi:glycerol-3-phosphate dehydrogenase